MILLLDNYDSFTYNLAHYCLSLGYETQVIRNDAFTLSGLKQMAPEKIIFSPGPGRPENAGIMMSVIDAYHHITPMLGICLGHQALAAYFGARIGPANQIMHGKTSVIHHTGEKLFDGIPSPYQATRYHSLAIKKDTLPTALCVTAWTSTDQNDIDEIMGIAHTHLPLFGVQFHPESILTEHGYTLLNNFLSLEDKPHETP